MEGNRIGAISEGLSLIIIISRRIRFLLMIIVLLVIGTIAAYNAKWIVRTIYPFHYRELVTFYSEKYEVDPYLVAAIIRNESKFNPNAISRREARGLMQIAPITGDWASEKLNIEDFNYEDLYDPELNIQIGTWYINILDKEFDSKLQLMVAAYNAGNGNVSKWLENPEYSKDGVHLDVIPFPETRRYVQKVLRDYERYEIIYEQGFRRFLLHLIRKYLI